MDPQLPEHDHCRYCGDPVEFDRAYCSEKCYYQDQKRISNEKRKNLIISQIGAIGVVGILVFGYLF